MIMVEGHKKNKYGYIVPKSRKGKAPGGYEGRNMTLPQKKKKFQNPKTPNY